MTRRLALAALAAIALVLLVAAPAFAGQDATSAEPYGWELQLRNTVSSQYSGDMTYKAFAAWAAGSGRTVTITDATVPTATVAYQGVALKTLVGYFDDQDPTTFNAALATAGYNVVVVSMDGYSVTFPSAKVAGLGDKLIVASLGNGEPLPVPSGPFMYNGALAYWPDWPLRVVSNDSSLSVDDTPQGVVRVSIVSATSPNAPAEPFAWDLQLRNTMTKKYNADMTSSAWAAWAAKAHRTVTITDSTVPTATVAYQGVSLKTLVGYFDDSDRNTFCLLYTSDAADE